MPGPSNNKGKPRSKNQRRSVSGKLPKSRESSMQLQPIHDSPSDTTRQRRTSDVSSEQSSTPSTPTPSLKAPPAIPPYSLTASPKDPPSLPEHIPRKIEEVMLQEPFIYDPGNGPRVRDARTFMSSFFALPASKEVSRFRSGRLTCFYVIHIMVYFLGSSMRRVCTRGGFADVVHRSPRGDGSGAWMSSIKGCLADPIVTDSLVQQKPFRKPCMSRLPKAISPWRRPARPTRRSAR
jgi:hypothetical protein